MPFRHVRPVLAVMSAIIIPLSPNRPGDNSLGMKRLGSIVAIGAAGLVAVASAATAERTQEPLARRPW